MEKSLKKTLLTTQQEVKDCGGLGATSLPVGLLLESKPCSLKREGPGLLSLPPQLLASCALPSRPPHSCVLVFRVPLEIRSTVCAAGVSQPLRTSEDDATLELFSQAVYSGP
ncbi:hypothetical protein U0070_010522 [Myodes glareolus]|uniref:Uncharacterized protein n=1 Tax=Myodes glareolus TaxID=447135 RepID=A0AAW0I560_MYOGA